MTPEFSRPIRIDAIGEAPRTIEIEADDRERAALARRFGIEAIDALTAAVTVRRHAAGVLAEGRVAARVVQLCVATAAPLTAAVDAPFRLLFVPEPEDEGTEIELDPDALDTLPLEGGAVDLGEAAAETLSLALDPYPRAPDAAAALRAAGVIGEENARAAGPFAQLGERLATKKG